MVRLRHVNGVTYPRDFVNIIVFFKFYYVLPNILTPDSNMDLQPVALQPSYGNKISISEYIRYTWGFIHL